MVQFSGKKNAINNLYENATAINANTFPSNYTPVNTSVSGNLQGIDTEIGLNKTDIATNTANISSNTSAISTNTSNISSNTSNISSNTSAIATNTSNIATNTTNISSNTSSIATNTTNISSNTSAIATNTTNIATNTSNISTNTTNIASNTSAITALQANFPTVSVSGTSSKTLALSDKNTLQTIDNATTVTVTIPPNSSVAFPSSGATIINFIQSNAGQITFLAGAGVTINSYLSKLSTAGQYASCSLTKISTNVWQLTGALI